jgi:hypothetical protein
MQERHGKVKEILIRIERQKKRMAGLITRIISQIDCMIRLRPCAEIVRVKNENLARHLRK